MKNNTKKLVLSGLFLAIGLLLPFLTGQIPQVGSMLCPMHIPVFLCGLICGAPWGAAVGLILPPLRFLLFHIPPLYPVGIAMAFEMAVYGLVCGLLYKRLSHNLKGIYVSLIAAMISGRVVWGIVRAILAGIAGTPFGMQAFLAGAITTAIPGIILHLILVPLIVEGLRRAKVIQ